VNRKVDLYGAGASRYQTPKSIESLTAIDPHRFLADLIDLVDANARLNFDNDRLD